MEIDNLLKAGESQTAEFKKSFGRETIETLVAFANTQGGTVFIGIADDGFVYGTSVGKETLNEWLGQIKSGTSPSIIPDIEALTVQDRTIVRIRIHEYPVKPVNTKGRYFKRIATSNHQLSLGEITDLYLQSLQISWDAHEAPGASLDALSLDKIEKFIAQVNQSGRFTLDPSPLLALEKLKFISQGHPTWAALLLFADEPLRHHIHIGRFKTSSIIIDDRQITDTLFEAVEQAMKCIIAIFPWRLHLTVLCNRRNDLPILWQPCAKCCSTLLSIGIIPALLISKLKFLITASAFSVRENSMVI